MKRSLLVAVVIAVASTVLIVWFLPPARLSLSTSSSDGTVRGILHIHTNRSDGRSSPDGIAAIAAGAGVKFLVFTDHGDGTRVPDPPTYRHGVLCLDGVEISSDEGHYIAIGMPAAPYPLGGEARDVVEDVHRLGGFGIAAHPDSPKAELRWENWDVPIDGMEIINPDTEWRSWVQRRGLQPKFTLLAALGTYPFRPGETIARLFGGEPSTLRSWMSLAHERKVIGVAGVDAHAKLALRDVEPGDNSFTLPFPGYGAAFRTLSLRLRPGRPLAGDAVADAAVILQALRAGHLYTSIDALAEPPFFEFRATNQSGTAGQGDELAVGGPLTLSIRSNAPSDAKTAVFNGHTIVSDAVRGAELVVPGSPGAYRVEIRLARDRFPLWIVSNPIYVREPATVRLKADPTYGAYSGADALFPTPALGWSVEHDDTSGADLIASAGEMIFRYALGADTAVRPRVALVASPHTVPPNDRVSFAVRADHPMRISVQLRAGGEGAPEERWQRSVYIDTEPREHTIPFADFRPVGIARTERPSLAANPSLLFVIETTNTKPGTKGELSITRVALER